MDCRCVGAARRPRHQRRSEGAVLMHRRIRRLVYWIALPLLFAVTSAQQDSSPGSVWPGYRGQNREGVYQGPIRTSWDGLTPMWKKPVGGGRASFSVADG